MKTFHATPIATLINANGIAFNMRLVRKGDGYGRDLAVIHDRDEPLVEFYDARYIFEGEEKGAEFGQFVSRYYASTLLRGRRTTGLNLERSVPAWTVDAAAMALAYQILESWAFNLY